jgi:hypothetical protein
MTISNANKMNIYISIIFSVCIASLSYAQADIKKPKDKEKKQSDSLATQAPCNHGDTLNKMYKSILQIQAHQDSIYSYKTKNAQLTDDNNRLTQEKATLSTDNKTLTTKVTSLEAAKTSLSTDKQRAETNLSALQLGLSNQVNTILVSLKSANYTTNTNILNNLIELAKLSSNNVVVAQLEDFKVKSSAIQVAMTEINSSKILSENQIKTIQTNLESAYAANNPNFNQLATDYKQCLDLLSKYSSYLCDLYYAFNTVVVDLKAGSLETKEDVIKDYSLQMRNYPTFVNLIQKIINDKFVSNPLEGKVNCN